MHRLHLEFIGYLHNDVRCTALVMLLRFVRAKNKPTIRKEKKFERTRKIKTQLTFTVGTIKYIHFIRY